MSIISGILAVLSLTAVDQITKYFAKLYLSSKTGISIIPGVFELFYLENRGAAFGMMADRQWLFVWIAVFMMAAAVYVYVKLPGAMHYMPLRIVCILIVSGAAGNMIDRLCWNYVIDFLYFSLIDFPVFNIADCYICIGAALAVLLIFTIYSSDHFEFLALRKNKSV